MKRPLLLALAIVLVGSSVALAMLKKQAPPLPNYGVVPQFTLVGADGKPFGSHDLDGKPWVADFVFTMCPEVCPRMTEEMAKLQGYLLAQKLDGKVKLVSVSVDPDHDTPAVLTEYAAKFHARPATWSFLTGPQAVVEDAVVHGFKMAMGKEKDDSQDGFAIVHGTKFVLIDGKQQIRGYYDSNDPQSLTALRRDLTALAEDAP